MQVPLCTWELRRRSAAIWGCPPSLDSPWRWAGPPFHSFCTDLKRGNGDRGFSCYGLHQKPQGAQPAYGGSGRSRNLSGFRAAAARALLGKQPSLGIKLALSRAVQSACIASFTIIPSYDAKPLRGRPPDGQCRRRTGRAGDNQRRRWAGRHLTTAINGTPAAMAQPL